MTMAGRAGRKRRRRGRTTCEQRKGGPAATRAASGGLYPRGGGSSYQGSWSPSWSLSSSLSLLSWASAGVVLLRVARPAGSASRGPPPCHARACPAPAPLAAAALPRFPRPRCAAVLGRFLRPRCRHQLSARKSTERVRSRAKYGIGFDWLLCTPARGPGCVARAPPRLDLEPRARNLRPEPAT
jgi:hypothetical protein